MHPASDDSSDVAADSTGATSTRPVVPRWLAGPRLGLVLLATALVVLAWLGGPLLLWAYDIERAGTLIDAGMRWPDPRRATSLPQLSDRQALEQALTYLDAAIRRRPAHAHAYRLSGQVYAALGDWEHAAAAYEQAIDRDPANQLVRWEASLVYDRMQQAVDRGPHTPLLDAFAAGTLLAPGELVKSLFCSERGAASCYFGRTAYRLPYAAYPSELAFELPVLFLHPPASLAERVTIPPNQTALYFVVGLDPVARGWATDGGWFHVWVQPEHGERQLAGELAVDRAMALRGWVPGWADLSRWAGQTVMLTIESGAGAQSDRADDWYGWGALELMPPDQAGYAIRLPRMRASQLRHSVR